MNDRVLLDGWKAISTYFGKSLKTVQRWEREASLPVHRVPGKHSVFAWTDELDKWKEKHSDSNGSIGKTPHGIKVIFLIVSISCLILFGGFLVFPSFKTQGKEGGGRLCCMIVPVGTGSMLTVRNTNNKIVKTIMWSQPYGLSEPESHFPGFYDVADINGDGLQDFIIANPSKLGFLDIFLQTIRGRLEFAHSIDLHRSLTIDGTNYELDKIQVVRLFDINSDGRMEFIVIIADRAYFPNELLVLNDKLKPILIVRHPGRLNRIVAVDLNHDNRKELVVSGTNNYITEFSEPVVFSIDSDWQFQNKTVQLYKDKREMADHIEGDVKIVYARLNWVHGIIKLDIPWQSAFLREWEELSSQYNMHEVFVRCTKITDPMACLRGDVTPRQLCIRLFNFGHNLKLIHAEWREDLLYQSNRIVPDDVKKKLLIPRYWNGKTWQTTPCQIPNWGKMTEKHLFPQNNTRISPNDPH